MLSMVIIFSLLGFSDEMNVVFNFENSGSKDHLYDYRFIYEDPTTKTYFILLSHVFERLKLSPNVFYNNLNNSIDLKNYNICGTPMKMTPKNVENFDFLPTTVKNPMYFIYEKPLIAYVHNIYLLPYDQRVWFSGLAMGLMFLLIMYLLMSWEFFNPELKTDSRLEFQELCIEEVGILAQQGTEIEPRSIGGGLILIIKLLSYMFLFLAYSASIVSLIQSRAEVVDSLDDLLISKMELGIEDDLGIAQMFEEEPNPVKRLIYQRKIRHNAFNTRMGLEKMHTEYFGFHIQEQKVFHLIKELFLDSEICCLKTVPFLTNFEPRIFLSKNSIFTEDIRSGMMFVQELGLLHREFVRFSPMKPLCFDNGNEFVIVGFLHCYTAFLLFGVGIFLSFVVFLGEVVVFRYRNRGNKNV